MPRSLQQHEVLRWPRTSKRTTKGSFGRAAKWTRRCISTSNGSKSRSSSAGVTRQPALSPCAKGAHQDRQFLARLGDGVFRAVGAIAPRDRPCKHKRLEPFGEDGAGHTGNAPADVVEAAGARQDFPTIRASNGRPAVRGHAPSSRTVRILSYQRISMLSRKFRYGFRTGSWPDVMALSTGVVPLRTGKSGMSGFHPCTNPLRGVGAVGELYSAPEPLADAASKVGALPQTPPGTEPLDLNAYARFR